MNKKGQGMSWFLVSIIIALMLLVVFVLIAIFFPAGETLDRSACKTSIVLRATLPSDIEGVSVNVKDVVNIRCQTQKICVTAKSSGKGNCTGLGKDYDTRKLTGSNSTEQATQIKMFLAREMADCWGMFGEGKLQIFAREFKSATFTSKGIICDKIEFDNSVLYGKDEIPGTEDDIQNITGLTSYMVMHKVPNNNYSYMDYLRGTSEGQSAEQLFGSMVNSVASDAKQKDILSLSGVKSIVYIESTLTNFAERLGGGVGFVAGSVGAFYTRAAGSGFLASALVIGGTVLGSNAGDSIFKAWFVPTGFCPEGANRGECSNHVGGLILTDYSLEGFSKWQIDSFENL